MSAPRWGSGGGEPKPDPRMGAVVPEEVFYPVEHAVLARYLGLEDRLPEAARGIDLAAIPQSGWDEEEGGIAPAEPVRGDDDLALQNAVARIALESVQERLPQVAVGTPEGLVFGREVVGETPRRPSLSVPLHLFTINWADTAPGVSWPEAYYLTWIPYYDRFVVTASDDSGEALGFTDIAIGHFEAGPGADAEELVGGVLLGWWRNQAWQGQEAWAYVWEPGAIGDGVALGWREQVWGG